MKTNEFLRLKEAFRTMRVAFRSVIDRNRVHGDLHLRPSGSLTKRAYLRVPKGWAEGAYVDVGTLQVLEIRVKAVRQALEEQPTYETYAIEDADGNVVEEIKVPAGGRLAFRGHS